MTSQIRRSFTYSRLILIMWLLYSISWPQTSAVTNASGNSYEQRTKLAIHGLQLWYDEHTGLYRTTGWWNAANAITTLADYSKITGSKEYDPVFSNTLSMAQTTNPGFVNNFYDDEGWWALAWIDVYDLNHDEGYLAIAQSIFANMTGGWNNTCSGGIWWSKDRNYKNAIANELFLSVAAHLATRAKNSKDRKAYLRWAKREWRWFSRSGMINTDGLVNDGLDERCTNNHKTTWTCNQGVIVGALVELYRADHQSAHLSMAGAIAAAALSALVLTDANGILREPCEPECGADGSQFKGIFVRNLTALNEVAPLPKYGTFILSNANSIWSGANAPDYHLGLMWSAPFGIVTASTQSSAADALVAAVEIQKQIRLGFIPMPASLH